MGIFNSILNIFFEEENRPVARPAQAPVAQAAQSIAPPEHTATTTVIDSATHSPAAEHALIDEKVYKEFTESLRRALENNNLPGFDFFEFRQLFIKFKTAGKSDNEAMETALASAETMRVDKNMIIAHYQHYEKVLHEQRTVFDQEFKAFYQDNIRKPVEEQQRIGGELLEKENAIRQFTADIEALKARKQKLGGDIVRAEQQTKQVEASFHKAFQDVTADLQAIVTRLKSG